MKTTTRQTDFSLSGRLPIRQLASALILSSLVLTAGCGKKPKENLPDCQEIVEGSNSTPVVNYAYDLHALRQFNRCTNVSEGLTCYYVESGKYLWFECY